MALVTCATLAAAIAAATPGSSISLQPGSDCSDVYILKRDWSAKPITINAEGSQVRRLRIMHSHGVHWKGGTIVAVNGRKGDGPLTYGSNVRFSSDVRIENATFTEAVRGIVVGSSRNVQLLNNRFVDLRMDAINLADTADSVVDGNYFGGFDPIPSTCNKKDGRVEHGVNRHVCTAANGEWIDGDHSDAVQMWNKPRDIRISNNVIEGRTQAIGLFGPRGDYATRITVENNHIRVDNWHGVTLGDCTDCRIVGNDIDTASRGTKFRPIIRAKNSTGVFCGNKVANSRPGEIGLKRCKK